MYRWCVTGCWRNIVWLWERELVLGKYVVEATRRVAGGVHLRPTIDVSNQARTPRMGSLDTAPPVYLWPWRRLIVPKYLFGLLPALLVMGLTACRAVQRRFKNAPV